MSNKVEFEDQCFKTHNALRKVHGAVALVQDPNLTKYAQNWADHMAGTGVFEHSTSEYGENIAFKSISTTTGDEFSRMWYSEVKDYDFTTPERRGGPVTGHFTQVVWKGTTKAGFGIATGRDGAFAVGTYFPAGNMRGSYAKNVGAKDGEPDLPKVDQVNKDTRDGGKQSTPMPNKPTSLSSESNKMPKPGVTVETKVEIVKEDGAYKKKTITTTTTRTETSGGGMRTGTSTSTQIESLPRDYSGEMGVLSTKLEEMAVSEKKEKHDGKDVLSKKEVETFSKELTDSINKLRKKHQAGRLEQSSSLNKIAHDHAQKMLKKDDLTLLTADKVLGKSYSMKMPRPSGETTADSWYSGEKEYDYSKPEFSNKTGNFTQLVWKECKQIGVGVASNKDGLTYIIALYEPAGNVTNHFKANVLPKK